MEPKYFVGVYIGETSGFTYVQNVKGVHAPQHAIRGFSTKVAVNLNEPECENSWKWKAEGIDPDGDKNTIISGVNFFAYVNIDLEESRMHEWNKQYNFKKGDASNTFYSLYKGNNQYELVNAAKIIMKGALKEAERIIKEWETESKEVNWRRDVVLWLFYDGIVENMKSWKTFMENLYGPKSKDNSRNTENEKSIDFGPVEYHHISSVYAWEYLNDHKGEKISHFEWKNNGMGQSFKFEDKREIFILVNHSNNEGIVVTLPKDVNFVLSEEERVKKFGQYVGEVIRKEIVLSTRFRVDNTSPVELCLLGAASRTNDNKNEGNVEIYQKEDRMYWETTSCLSGNKDRLFVLFYSEGWSSKYKSVEFDLGLTEEEKAIIKPNQKVVLSLVPRPDVAYKSDSSVDGEQSEATKTSGGVNYLRDNWKVRMYFSDLGGGKKSKEVQVINKLKEKMYTEVLSADPKSNN